MNHSIIKYLESLQIKNNLNFYFNTGDLIEVKSWVIEGNKKRIQSFEGIVISIRNKALQSNFTVRKISYNEGVERVFYIHSPMIDSIITKRVGRVRRSKLYYLRKLSGKSARIKEKIIK